METWHATQVVLVSYKAGIARRESRWCWFDPQAKDLFGGGCGIGSDRFAMMYEASRTDFLDEAGTGCCK